MVLTRGQRGRTPSGRSLGDLPPELLLRVARRLNWAEDLCALRAACRGHRAALDADAWRELTRARFGSRAAGEGATGSLEAEMRRYGRRESPVLPGSELESEEWIGDTPEWYNSTMEFHRTFEFSAFGEFKGVRPGKYVLEARTKSYGDSPLDVTLEWSASEGGWDSHELKGQLKFKQHDFARMLQDICCWQTARCCEPFRLPTRRSRQPYTVGCSLSSSAKFNCYDGLVIKQLRLRRLRSRAAA